MLTNHLPPPIAPLPANAAELQSALRRRREATAVDPAPDSADQPAKQERNPVEPMRSKMDAQEKAHLEAMIRRDATPDELNAWRAERGIHHKSFGAAVRAIRQSLDAPPSPMAAALAVLEPPAETAIEPPAVPVPASPRPGQIEPVIHWLATIRAMRDELAHHGVTVAGSLRIEIEL